MELESKVVQQYLYLFNQISRMTEVLMLHDTGERPLKERERLSLIKIRASEFNKLNRIIEKHPEVHNWYSEKDPEGMKNT
ncbi:hypothetical protein NRL14_20785 [Pseudoalteromonas sp. 20-92]|uniref:hypothetical protein n=1 Tax=Pseudoalteromonas sp. 20-92 TaxID=2969394 RepID=UPI0027B3F7FB|nr:hypothetical protein [Pseudoalteromonas sp. 20-92]MDQ2046129.1 hypothetical protein [Pseudoalteromonas sp. 20-92]